MTQHKHVDIIKAWADDPENTIIQYKHNLYGWCDAEVRFFNPDSQFRIKPDSSIPVACWKWLVKDRNGEYFVTPIERSEEDIENCCRHDGFKVICKVNGTLKYIKYNFAGEVYGTQTSPAL